MQTPTPKIIDTLTRVLGAVYATLGALMTATVLTDLHEAIPVVLGVATAIVGAVQIGLRTYASGQVTATDDVVEVRDGGQVLAGPANDKVGIGGHVRTIDYYPRHHVADLPQTIPPSVE